MTTQQHKAQVGRLTFALAYRNLDKSSMAELAELFEISRSMAHQLKTGKKTPSRFASLMITEKLNISYEWFMTGKGFIEGYQMQSASEVSLIEQFRNLTKAGQMRIVAFAFDECKNNEKTPKNKADKQIALALVKKK